MCGWLFACEAVNEKGQRAVAERHLNDLLNQLSAAIEQTSPDLNVNGNNIGMKIAISSSFIRLS